jgi:hypothetical protein
VLFKVKRVVPSALLFFCSRGNMKFLVVWGIQKLRAAVEIPAGAGGSPVRGGEICNRSRQKNRDVI